MELEKFKQTRNDKSKHLKTITKDLQKKKEQKSNSYSENKSI